MIIFSIGFLFIGFIYWLVWTFSPNKDAREETKKWVEKMSNNLSFLSEIWASIWGRIFEYIFGLIGLLILIILLLWISGI